MTKSKGKSPIDAGGAFGELLAKEFPSKAERAEFATDVQAELATIHALAQLEKKRKAAGVAKATIARRLGTPAPVVSRMFNSGDANPTLRTFAKTLSAMGMQAEIRYKKVRSGTPPLRVVSR
jgi:DNA-binding phage protein